MGGQVAAGLLIDLAFPGDVISPFAAVLQVGRYLIDFLLLSSLQFGKLRIE